MKKFLALIFGSALILGACGNDDTSNENSDTKSESKTEKKSEDKKENKSKEDKKSKEKKKSQENEDNSTEEQNTSNVEEKNNEKQNNQSDNEQNIQYNSSSEKSQNTQNVDVTNIKDRGTLESVIYGNYSETAKIQAYNNAVANGVIPQGNVMEGPASAAYESSLRVESGQEKSVYDRPYEEDFEPDEDTDDTDYTNDVQSSDSSYPRSLMQIKEETGKSPRDFTDAEMAEAQAYADAH
ncbi:DNA mismatch repair ATPase MutL [Staphylococcus hominis]